MDISIINRETVADILHQFTIDCADLALHALQRKLSREENKSAPMRIIKDKENSPLRCPVPNQKDQFILYYPANSEPYPFQLDGISKECYILLGEVHEKQSGMTYKKNDHFVIPPDRVYEPYTGDSIALALIILRPSDYQLPCKQPEEDSTLSKRQKDCVLKPINARQVSLPSATEVPATRRANR